MSISRWMDKKAVVHKPNGVLLSHEKENIWISSNEMDETGAYYTEWSKSERKTKSMASGPIRSDQWLSHVQLFATPWIAACQASLSITNSRSSHKLMSIESMMPSSHLILCRPLLLLPPIPPSIRVFSNESTLRMRWPKYWSFSFSVIPCKEHPGLISFRMDWLDVLAVQGTFKSLLQYHSSKASILQSSAFFIVQLSYPFWRRSALGFLWKERC